jgi:protein-tyrosine phosphatase
VPPHNLARVIDLHCHVLPGIDDGPATMEGSLAFARAAEAAGITTLVATPHVSSRYPNTPAMVHAGVASVNRALQQARIDVEVLPGAELDLRFAAELDDDELRALRLGRGEWLLVECPLTVGTPGSFELLLYSLERRGHKIVLAHPERSPVLQRNITSVAALIRAGMICSITATSLTGQFGRHVRRFTLRLLSEGLVHNVTSDAHDAVRRPPGLRDPILLAAAEMPWLTGQLGWLTAQVPSAIVDGAPLPAAPGSLAKPRPAAGAKTSRWRLGRR